MKIIKLAIKEDRWNGFCRYMWLAGFGDISEDFVNMDWEDGKIIYFLFMWFNDYDKHMKYIHENYGGIVMEFNEWKKCDARISALLQKK